MNLTPLKTNEYPLKIDKLCAKSNGPWKKKRKPFQGLTCVHFRVVGGTIFLNKFSRSTNGYLLVWGPVVWDSSGTTPSSD